MSSGTLQNRNLGALFTDCVRNKLRRLNSGSNLLAKTGANSYSLMKYLGANQQVSPLKSDEILPNGHSHPQTRRHLSLTLFAGCRMDFVLNSGLNCWLPTHPSPSFDSQDISLTLATEDQNGKVLKTDTFSFLRFVDNMSEIIRILNDIMPNDYFNTVIYRFLLNKQSELPEPFLQHSFGQEYLDGIDRFVTITASGDNKPIYVGNEQTAQLLTPKLPLRRNYIAVVDYSGLTFEVTHLANNSGHPFRYLSTDFKPVNFTTLGLPSTVITTDMEEATDHFQSLAHFRPFSAVMRKQMVMLS